MEENSPAIRAREAALKMLVRAERDQAYTNLLLRQAANQLTVGERALAARIFYGTVQHLNTLDWTLRQFLKESLDNLTPWIRNLLRSAAYQVLYLERVPPPLVVDQSVRLAYRYGHKGVAGLVNAVLRRLASRGFDLPWPDPDREPSLYLSLYYSYPLWLIDRWLGRYGFMETLELCRANNTIQPVYLRANTLLTNCSKLAARLKKEGLTEVQEHGEIPGCLKVTPRGSLSDLPSYREGLFSVQGEASMICSYLLDPRPGEKVVDLCCAPGGKTTHMAERMMNEGAIIAGDINSARIRLVEKAARRLKISIIQTRVWDGREAERQVSSVDRLLCDAPCSGLGVISRRPDLKWRKKEDDILALSSLQRELLDAASRMVKRGGYLLYSVCSNEPEETGEVLAHFLEHHTDYSPEPLPSFPLKIRKEGKSEGIVEFMPHLHRKEGFYMALLKRRR